MRSVILLLGMEAIIKFGKVEYSDGVMKLWLFFLIVFLTMDIIELIKKK